MFILLFIFALFRHLQGAPTSVHSTSACDPTEIFLRDDTKHLGTLQLSDIVISCIATIFACTWTAVHPNIPSPCDSGWEVFKRQITTMIYAILAPEAVTGCALRHNLSARRITEYYNHEIAKKYLLVERPRHNWFRRKPLHRPLRPGEVVAWTVTHGFFAHMGGFMLCKDGHPVKISKYLLKHISEGSISAPSITQAEIEDRSKGDGLSKTIVVIQTTWFVTQCIVRWSLSLPVTELEVVTLGFAMLNALTYGLWWNKPQSIALPINLEMKDAVRNEMLKPGAEVEEENIATDAQDEQNADNGEQAAPQKENGPPPKRSYLTIKLEKDEATGWQIIWRIPYRLVQAALRPLSRMVNFSWTYVEIGDLRVPMFYSALFDSKVVYVASSTIASVFGLVHLIPAWFLEFPSRPEMVLWRISAGIITAQPIVLGLWA